MPAPMSVIEIARIKAMCELAAMTPMGGCFVEVGVFKGGSAWHLAEVARERGAELHLFDTFTGIPFADPDDSNATGDFADTSLEAVQCAITDAITHPGIFPDTLPADLGPISFVHCDCDQYRSVRSVIDRLVPRMLPGAVMVFDDTDTVGGRRAISETWGDSLHQHFGRHYFRKEAE